MHIQFSYRKIDKNEKKTLKQKIQENADLLTQTLGRFDTEAVRLEGAVERHGNRNLYRARLKLHLPGKTLVALEEASDAGNVIHAAFAELRRQAERFKHLARNDHLWKRPKRREKLQQLKQGSQEAEQARLFLELLQPRLPELYHFIRRELAYHQALGDLSPTDIQPDEVLDAVLVRGHHAFAQRPAHLDILAWLMGLAVTLLQEEVQAHQLRERRVSPEAPVPMDAMDISDDEDSRYYEFYQPDEVIRMEDILPDPESEDPETAQAQRERDLQVHRILTLLPPLWRQTLVLMDIHDMTPETVAEVLALPVEQLARIRNCAEAFMRQWLSQTLSAEDLQDDNLEKLLGTPLREPLPEELEQEILEKLMPVG